MAQGNFLPMDVIPVLNPQCLNDIFLHLNDINTVLTACTKAQKNACRFYSSTNSAVKYF